jgi:hypothetical protein
VHGSLGMHGVRDEPPRCAVVQSDAGIVARGLDAEDKHRIILIQFSPFSSSKNYADRSRQGK